jgi:hypothetical protein
MTIEGRKPWIGNLLAGVAVKPRETSQRAEASPARGEGESAVGSV